MGCKRFIKGFLDRFKKKHETNSKAIKNNPQTVEEIIDHEFFYRGLGKIETQKVMGMTFGLQKPRYDFKKSASYDSFEIEMHRQVYSQMTKSIIGEFYEQVFIIRENEWDTIMVATNDESNPNRFSSDLLYIADKYGWKFMEKAPALDILFPIKPQIKNLFYLTQPQILETYRNDIDRDRDITGIKHYI